jgi:hypothetical protein
MNAAGFNESTRMSNYSVVDGGYGGETGGVGGVAHWTVATPSANHPHPHPHLRCAPPAHLAHPAQPAPAPS